LNPLVQNNCLPNFKSRLSFLPVIYYFGSLFCNIRGMINKNKIAALSLISLLAGNTYAQVCHNLYPYAQGVVSDNNGHDLDGFIKSNSKDVLAKAPKIKEYSDGAWGYLQVKNARVPTVDIHRVDDKYERVHLNYAESIDATLALCDTKDGLKATWWARQCNNPNGPLFQKRTDDDGKMDVSVIRYHDIMTDLDAKKFTIVEYNSQTYNRLDYDELLKNYFTLENGIIKDATEYRTIIEFYNNFLSKFTYVEDPLLEDKSFVTLFSTGNHKFIGYFNIANSKLSGHLEPVDIQFESDKDTVTHNIFKHLTGKKIFVYGDEDFGLEKTILRYAYAHKLKTIRRNTATTDKFNKE